jgi:rhodanese-related sulfurtransferase
MFRKGVQTIAAVFLAMLMHPAFAEKQSVPESIDGTSRVTAEEVIELVGKQPDLVIIDARKVSDHEKGFIEGSISLPDTETTPESLASHVASKDTPVLFYCNGVKCGRSVKSAEKAVSWGYKNVHWFRGGWEEWIEKGYPVSY